MNKQLTRLETSFDNEHHIYTWKQIETWRMIFLWVSIGLLWLGLLYIWSDLSWNLINIYIISLLISSILYNLYISVLKTSLEVNADKLKLTKTPFNLLGKAIKLETIRRIYCERQMFGKLYYVNAELTNGKSKKLLFGLKEEVADELALYLNKSTKHFQQAQFASTIKPRPTGLND